VALDQATTDRWARAEGGYREAITLARETGQQAAEVFALSGLAGLLARRGRESECRACAAQTLDLCPRLGTRLHEIWAVAALATLELGLGDAGAAAVTLERQQALLAALGFTDPDVSPAPDLVEAYVRLGRLDEAETLAAEFAASAEVKGQPWSLARAQRCRGLVAGGARLADCFELALAKHERTPDSFEEARTRLAYGERLRRARNRILAREQLRAALDVFERLGADPWADRARGELAATGATVRARDPATADELTAQELQIAELLAGGRTTREAAAALFLSPKTIEYHLRHVYMKLGVHSRGELAELLPAPANRGG
ncbi:MAG: helix-turn-helix transcriptional regulator, partial [Solirubrobacteraceae bacterium]